jgi:hypothetical protein
MKKKLGRTGTTAWTCIKGPWPDEALHLTSPITAWFTLHGVTGRYAFGRWQVAK